MEKNELFFKEVSFNYFGGYVVFSNISIDLYNQKKFCVLGTKGSGKSTFIKLISGLEKPIGGKIEYSGKDLNNISLKDRNFGEFFNDYAFLKRKNVFNNIARPLKLRNFSDVDIANAVSDITEFLGIKDLYDYKIDMLSEVQKTLVALARLFVLKRDIYLLDNPLENLCLQDRDLLLEKLNSLTGLNDSITIFTTDRIEEAEAFSSDLNAIIAYNTILDIGNLNEIYTRPSSIAVCKVIAQNRVNLIKVEILNGINIFGTRLSDQNKLINEIFKYAMAAFYFDEIKIVEENKTNLLKDDLKEEKIIATIFGIKLGVKNSIISARVGETDFSFYDKVPCKFKIGDDVAIEFSNKNLKIFDINSEMSILKRR